MTVETTRSDPAHLTVVISPPAVDLDSMVTRWVTHLDESTTATVIGPEDAWAHDLSVPIHTPNRVAHRILDAHGWTVPPALVNGERSIATGEGDRPQLRSWFHQLYDAFPTHHEYLTLVDDPSLLVKTLEELVGDCVLPTESGWYQAGEQRLHGDMSDLRVRSESLAEAVSGVDRDALKRAGLADRSVIDDFLHDVLEHYLGWCLKRRMVTATQVRAYAATHGHSFEDDAVLIVADTTLNASTLHLGGTYAGDRMTVVVSPRTLLGSDLAWLPTSEGYRRWVKRRWDGPISLHRLSDDVAARETWVLQDIENHPLEAIEQPPTVKQWSLTATDPTARVVDVLDALLNDDTPRVDPSDAVSGPSDIHVVVPTRQHARRVLRHCRDSIHPVTRVGSVEIHRSDIAILSLAWLRILENRDSDRGWAVVLEAAGCSPGDINAWLDRDDRPSALAAFASDLRDRRTGPAVIATVAQRYALDGRAVDALTRAISPGDGPPPSRMETIERIEVGFDRGRTVTLDVPTHPVVEVHTFADSMRRVVPVTVHVLGGKPTDRRPFTYRPPLGVRATVALQRVGDHHVEVADPNWETLTAVRTSPTRSHHLKARHTAHHASAHAIAIGVRESPLEGAPLEFD